MPALRSPQASQHPSSPFPLFSSAPFSLLLVLLPLFLSTFLYLSTRGQAHAVITPEQAIALALGDIEPVGDNFRISDMGGDVNYDAYHPKAAYNATDHLYLVVWEGDDNTGSLVDDEFEIFSQLIDAKTGDDIGVDFRISDMGADGDANYDASKPDVSYNPEVNEFLVIWEGDDNTSPLVNDEFEIFGQRLNGTTGAEIGPNDFRISDMGTDGNVNFGAHDPAVTYNPTDHKYLVVWWGDDNASGLINDEYEIFGQRLDAPTGAEIGGDFRISDMGGTGNVEYAGNFPSIAFNATNHEYLVVWDGDDDVNGLANDEYEIFGQRLNAATGAEVGENDFRISDMGDNAPIWGAFWPKIAYNVTQNEYLVVWQGDDNENGLVDEENEIFGQRLNAETGMEIGTNDFRISDMGPDGNPSYDARVPEITFNSLEDEYLVVWQGDDNTLPLVDEEFEIYGQRIDAETGGEIGANDFRISMMGPDGDLNFNAAQPEVAYDFNTNSFLVAWWGDTNTQGLVDEEFEIFGQRLQYLTPTPTPTLTPTPTSTSTATPPPTPHSGAVYLPLAVRPIVCLAPYLESEPNGPPESAADGPLCINQPYTAYPNDNWDYFTFTLNAPHSITIEVNNHPLASVNGVQVQLYYQTVSTANKVGEAITPPYQIMYEATAGTYYLIVFTDTSKCGSCEQPYSLQVNYP